MAPWRRAALVLLSAAMVWIMAATWGSVGSVVMAFGLVMLAASLLYQRFLTNDDPDSRDFYE